MKIKVSTAQATQILNQSFGGGSGLTPMSPIILYMTKLNGTQQQYVSAFVLVGTVGNYSGSSVTVGSNFNTWFELTDDTFTPATLTSMGGIAALPVDGIED